MQRDRSTPAPPFPDGSPVVQRPHSRRTAGLPSRLEASGRGLTRDSAIRASAERSCQGPGEVMALEPPPVISPKDGGCEHSQTESNAETCHQRGPWIASDDLCISWKASASLRRAVLRARWMMDVNRGRRIRLFLMRLGRRGVVLERTRAVVAGAHPMLSSHQHTLLSKIVLSHCHQLRARFDQNANYAKVMPHAVFP